MAFDNPLPLIILFLLIGIGLLALIVFVLVKVAKFAWGNKPVTSQTSSVPMQTSSQQVSLSDMKFCVKCGTKIPKMAEFCSSCGGKQL